MNYIFCGEKISSKTVTRYPNWALPATLVERFANTWLSASDAFPTGVFEFEQGQFRACGLLLAVEPAASVSA